MTDERRPRTNWPHDAPDARELIEAVRDYLADDLGPRSEGRDRWMVRIAANALAIAGRELDSGPADATAHTDRLARLGVADEEELARAIRDGSLDNRRAELTRLLWATTLDKLTVANPAYRDEASEPASVVEQRP